MSNTATENKTNSSTTIIKGIPYEVLQVGDTLRTGDMFHCGVRWNKAIPEYVLHTSLPAYRPLLRAELRYVLRCGEIVTLKPNPNRSNAETHPWDFLLLGNFQCVLPNGSGARVFTQGAEFFHDDVIARVLEPGEMIRSGDECRINGVCYPAAGVGTIIPHNGTLVFRRPNPVFVAAPQLGTYDDSEGAILPTVPSYAELQRDLDTAQKGNRDLSATLDTERELRKCAEQNLLNLTYYTTQGRRCGLNLSGNAVTVRDRLFELQDRVEAKDAELAVVHAELGDKVDEMVRTQDALAQMEAHFYAQREKLAAARNKITGLVRDNEAHRDELASLFHQLAASRSKYRNAAKTIADMHKAATGEVCGPFLGLVEDIVDLRGAYLAWKSEAERWRKVAEDNLRCKEAWEQTSAHISRDAEYYLDLLVRIGKLFGVEAYRCDNGAYSDSVLVSKVPELVERFITTQNVRKNTLTSSVTSRHRFLQEGEVMREGDESVPAHHRKLARPFWKWMLLSSSVHGIALDSRNVGFVRRRIF